MSYKQSGKIQPSFQILLFGLQRKKTTNIFLEKLKMTCSSSCEPPYPLRQYSVTFHLGMQECTQKLYFANPRMTKELPPMSISKSSSLLRTSDTFSSLYTTSLNPLRANPTKWSYTLKQFVGCCQRTVWVCLIILRGWRLKGSS